MARIASILGMSFSIAIGLLLLIGGLILPALLAFIFFVPSFALMAVVERHASRPSDAPEPAHEQPKGSAGR